MEKKEILRVTKNIADIKRLYKTTRRTFGAIEEIFERKIRFKGLKLLNIKEGEIVLEIGFGRGEALIEISKAVGSKGKAYGIDITPERVEFTKKRFEKIRLASRVDLREGDARKMAYKKELFDAVYIASTLELFDTPDIPKVLIEIKRVLKPTGRLLAISISRKNRECSKIIKIFEWQHQRFSQNASCRPIYLEESLINVGYKIIEKEELLMAKIFPMKIVVAKPITS